MLLAWFGLALMVIVAGLVLTSNQEPPRYLTLNVIAEQPSAENEDEAERQAA
jgi:hypothetical protein